MRLGVLTMVRSSTARKQALARNVPTIIPHTTPVRLRATVTGPVTPIMPGNAPGTMMMLDAAAGSGQIPGTTYQTIEESAPPFQTVAQPAPTRQASPLVPLAALAALYFMG